MAKIAAIRIYLDIEKKEQDLKIPRGQVFFLSWLDEAKKRYLLDNVAPHNNPKTDPIKREPNMLLIPY